MFNLQILLIQLVVYWWFMIMNLCGWICIYLVWIKYNTFCVFCRFFCVLILWKYVYIVNRLNMMYLVEKNIDFKNINNSNKFIATKILLRWPIATKRFVAISSRSTLLQKILLLWEPITTKILVQQIITTNFLLQ